MKNLWDLMSALFYTFDDVTARICSDYCKYQAEIDAAQESDAVSNDEYFEIEEKHKEDHCLKCPVHWWGAGSCLDETDSLLEGSCR